MKRLIWLVLLVSLVASCAKQLDAVRDASDKRRIVCGFINEAPVSNLTLEKARKLCAAGADLEEIARAYGGCELPQ